MKKLTLTCIAILISALTAKDKIPADPFGREIQEDPVGPVMESPVTGIYSIVTEINLNASQTVKDAFDQIIAGLSPEGRAFVVLDVPEAELEKLKMKKALRLRNISLPVLMQFLGEHSPMGYQLWNNQWHISNERKDDIIAVKYLVSEAAMEQLGVLFGPGQTFTTKSGKMWPPESEASVSLEPANPKSQRNLETGAPANKAENCILRLSATRGFHKEFNALFLLKSSGYEGLSLDR